MDLQKCVTKKGIIEEVFSKARFADNPNSYNIYYRDFEILRKITLPEFIKESENFQTIPISRIERITKDNTILFEKSKPEAD